MYANLQSVAVPGAQILGFEKGPPPFTIPPPPVKTRGPISQLQYSLLLITGVMK